MGNNRATVSDKGLGAAFAEGVNEGFRLTGYVRLICLIGGRARVNETVKASDVPKLMETFFAGLRGEHYEVGVAVRLMAEGDVCTEQVSDPAPRATPEVGDGVIDAEIVED